MLRELKGSTATHRGRRRVKRRRLAVILTIVILLLLLTLMSVAVFYMWYTSNKTDVKPTAIQTTLQSTPVSPPKAAVDTPVGVAISTLSTPIASGSNASVSIRTKQAAACTITFTYANKEKSTDSGLMPKTADEYGVVSWSWSIEQNRPAGTYSLEITCARDGKSGYRQADVVVTK